MAKQSNVSKVVSRPVAKAVPAKMPKAALLPVTPIAEEIALATLNQFEQLGAEAGEYSSRVVAALAPIFDDKEKREDARNGFMRGWIARIYMKGSNSGAVTVQALDLARICLDCAVKARTPEQTKAYNAAKAAFSNIVGRVAKMLDTSAPLTAAEKKDAEAKRKATNAAKAVVSAKGAKSRENVQAFALLIMGSIKTFVEGSDEKAIKASRDSLMKAALALELAATQAAKH